MWSKTCEISFNNTLYCTLHKKDKILAQNQQTTSTKFACILSLFYLSHASTYIGEILARYTALLYVHVHKIKTFQAIKIHFLNFKKKLQCPRAQMSLFEQAGIVGPEKGRPLSTSYMRNQL